MKLVKVNSCVLNKKQEVGYMTFQCMTCGLIPNSDFRRNRMRDDECATCRQYVEYVVASIKNPKTVLPTKEAKRMLVSNYISHLEECHPEQRLLLPEEYKNL
jgi:hypothetical protein